VATYWCERAWLPSGPVADVRVRVDGGVVTDLTVGQGTQPDDVRLTGLVLPGLADAHSHAFHRALRGRTGHDGGTFWTWRQGMYALAARLDPDSYLALARATFAELALGGVTCVGEFHYLHHAPGGADYADANAMSEALVQAAAEAGVRLTLLDTVYLAGGLGPDGPGELDEVQRRFTDGDAETWAGRMTALPPRPGLRVGAAVHSVRAVPRDQLPVVAALTGDRPLHVHLSEQPAENEACIAAYGCTPATILAEAGLLGPRTTAVHAVHLTADDVALLGGSRTTVCACPTTEADLADGIGPFRELADAGCRIALGTDQHVNADLFAEARGLEAGERLRSGQRGRFTSAELIDALTAGGHASLGWPAGGRIALGVPADLVVVDPDSPRTAGAGPEEVPLVASGSDVRTVIVDGRMVVSEGRHVLGDVGRMLREAIEPLWEDA
jgi:formiminoglutamate deiminase